MCFSPITHAVLRSTGTRGQVAFEETFNRQKVPLCYAVNVTESYFWSNTLKPSIRRVKCAPTRNEPLEVGNLAPLGHQASPSGCLVASLPALVTSQHPAVGDFSELSQKHLCDERHVHFVHTQMADSAVDTSTANPLITTTIWYFRPASLSFHEEFTEFTNDLGDSFLTHCHRLWVPKLPPLTHLDVIGEKFMSNCFAVEALDLSPIRTVRRVGREFLSCCYALREIDLSPLARVESVGCRFLYQCSSLVKVDLSPLKSLQHIPDSFLNLCSNLTTIDLRHLPFRPDAPSGVYLLNGCAGLTHIDLRPLRSITRIEEGFLGSCTGLVSIDLSPLQNVRVIGDCFLGGCSSLRELDLRPLKGVSVVGSHLLYNCLWLVDIDLSPLRDATVGDHVLDGARALYNDAVAKQAHEERLQRHVDKGGNIKKGLPAAKASKRKK